MDRDKNRAHEQRTYGRAVFERLALKEAQSSSGDPWRNQAFVKKMDAYRTRILAAYSTFGPTNRCGWCGEDEATCLADGGCCTACTHDGPRDDADG